ncbi:hypothetical protein ABPG72_005937 [Tetrahymena utriculariae]
MIWESKIIPDIHSPHTRRSSITTPPPDKQQIQFDLHLVFQLKNLIVIKFSKQLISNRQITKNICNQIMQINQKYSDFNKNQEAKEKTIKQNCIIFFENSLFKQKKNCIIFFENSLFKQIVLSHKYYIFF